MNPLIHPRVFVSLICFCTVVVRSEGMLIADYCTDNRTGQSGRFRLYETQQRLVMLMTDGRKPRRVLGCKKIREK
ncbi:hypothetical protein [Serpens gallinarum]|uniref:Secreted protein n=1 Tax=Serpens gallinarum TaxID=2763075 RepID=A0ABR8TMU8_9PSED|nr:hypothetical protein [Serpens gallinarum]MBD7977078.1 hypothetical protein [Serpens gallinarum]